MESGQVSTAIERGLFLGFNLEYASHYLPVYWYCKVSIAVLSFRLFLGFNLEYASHYLLSTMP